MKHQKNYSQNGQQSDDSETVLIHHTQSPEGVRMHRVTVVASVIDNAVVLGFSICYPTDNFEKKYGRDMAYGKTKKNNYHRTREGSLVSEPSYCSYYIPENDLKMAGVIKEDGNLDKPTLKKLMANISTNITAELHSRQPDKAYPIIQSVCFNVVRFFMDKPELVNDHL